MTQYQRLNFKEREELSRGLSMGLSYRQIARLANRFLGTFLTFLLVRKTGQKVPGTFCPGAAELFKILERRAFFCIMAVREDFREFF